jgi:hypothetical protein
MDLEHQFRRIPRAATACGRDEPASTTSAPTGRAGRWRIPHATAAARCPSDACWLQLASAPRMQQASPCACACSLPRASDFKGVGHLVMDGEQERYSWRSY